VHKSAFQAWFRSTFFGLVTSHATVKTSIAIALIASALKQQINVDVMHDSLSDIPTIINSLATYKLEMKELKFVIPPQKKKGGWSSLPYITINRRPDALAVVIDFGAPGWTVSTSANHQMAAFSTVPECIDYDKIIYYGPWISPTIWSDGITFMADQGLTLKPVKGVSLWSLPWHDNYRTLVTKGLKGIVVQAPTIVRWKDLLEVDRQTLNMSTFKKKIHWEMKPIPLKEVPSFKHFRAMVVEKTAMMFTRPFTRKRSFVPILNWIRYNQRMVRHAVISDDSDDGGYEYNIDPNLFAPPTLENVELDFVVPEYDLFGPGNPFENIGVLPPEPASEILDLPTFEPNANEENFGFGDTAN